MTVRAVVPIAGRGSRLAPLTSTLPKALFPLVDPLGRCRPVIHWICAEAAMAGIEELAIVISPWQRQMLADYLEHANSVAHALPARVELLARHPQDYCLCRIQGRALDTGTPAGYAQTMADFWAPAVKGDVVSVMNN